MCNESIYERQVKKGFLTVQALLTDAALSNILTRQQSLSVCKRLLACNIITVVDLDSYEVSGWITAEEKAEILA